MGDVMLGSGEASAATLGLGPAMSIVAVALEQSNPGEAAFVSGVRMVIQDQRAMRGELAELDRNQIISAVSRLNGLGSSLEVARVVKADVALQRMGALRCSDLSNGVEHSRFDLSDLSAIRGRADILAHSQSRSDAIAMSRGDFQKLTPAMGVWVSAKLAEARQGYAPEAGLSPIRAQAQQAALDGRYLQRRGKGPTQSDNEVAGVAYPRSASLGR